ncbi:hypothetical protein BDF20DRAFT_999259 [Mycotypha africana]|uniref:uncharacterized protein n=1 Tax=Mycotypha africana TaxID=64632 RepID=UPI0023017D70|nr:uncharacterized protein BDF20DRAFT_999259 [Mycotypha africana]KAI8984215.1 hypothetical protein BDF20DRAFT_999259 [Mycotypha africana]
MGFNEIYIPLSSLIAEYKLLTNSSLWNPAYKESSSVEHLSCNESLKEGFCLENFSWRLWYRQQRKHQQPNSFFLEATPAEQASETTVAARSSGAHINKNVVKIKNISEECQYEQHKQIPETRSTPDLSKLNLKSNKQSTNSTAAKAICVSSTNDDPDTIVFSNTLTSSTFTAAAFTNTSSNDHFLTSLSQYCRRRKKFFFIPSFPKRRTSIAGSNTTNETDMTTEKDYHDKKDFNDHTDCSDCTEIDEDAGTDNDSVITKTEYTCYYQEHRYIEQKQPQQHDINLSYLQQQLTFVKKNPFKIHKPVSSLLTSMLLTSTQRQQQPLSEEGQEKRNNTSYHSPDKQQHTFVTDKRSIYLNDAPAVAIIADDNNHNIIHNDGLRRCQFRFYNRLDQFFLKSNH